MTVCSECEERPAVTAYRYGGTLCELCQKCADRIARTSCLTLEPLGPADNHFARQLWAQGIAHAVISQEFLRRPFHEVIDALAEHFEMPSFVRGVAAESRQIAGPVKLTLTG